MSRQTGIYCQFSEGVAMMISDGGEMIRITPSDPERVNFMSEGRLVGVKEFAWMPDGTIIFLDRERESIWHGRPRAGAATRVFGPAESLLYTFVLTDTEFFTWSIQGNDACTSFSHQVTGFALCADPTRLGPPMEGSAQCVEHEAVVNWIVRTIFAILSVSICLVSESRCAGEESGRAYCCRQRS